MTRGAEERAQPSGGDTPGVALVVGAGDGTGGAFVRETFRDLVKSRPADGILAPNDIAESYYAIHRQGRSAWTHELDLRPWVEPW